MVVVVAAVAVVAMVVNSFSRSSQHGSCVMVVSRGQTYYSSALAPIS